MFVRYEANAVGRVINEPIQISRKPSLFNHRLVPDRFTWRGKDYRVNQIGGEWRVLGRWGQGEGERRYVRAITSQGLAMDLCHDTGTGAWFLHALQD